MREKAKLKEAKYFYDEMVAHRNQRDEFIYNLSAFLSCARSVLQYAHKEAENKNNGKQWYDQHISVKPVVRFFRDKRDVNIHQEPVEPDTTEITTSNRITPSGSMQEVTVNLIPSAHPSISHHTYTFSELNQPMTYTPKQQAQTAASKSTWYTFGDWPGSEDALALCQQYIQELESIINDGISKLMITG